MAEPVSVRPEGLGLFRSEGGGVRLLAGRCTACGRLDFPRPVVCTYCRDGEIEPAPVGPEATLWAWTSVSVAPPGYDGPVPFGFGVVEVAGELRVITRITEADPSRLSVGQPGRLVAEELGGNADVDAVVVWTFEPSVVEP